MVNPHEEKHLKNNIMQAVDVLQQLHGLDLIDHKRFSTQLEQCCVNLHAWLLHYLPKTEQFIADRYIDEARFKQFWQQKFPHPQVVSADLSWYVIQHWIKGHQHAPIPLWYKHQTDYYGLDVHVLNYIEQYIWQGWYKPLLAQAA